MEVGGKLTDVICNLQDCKTNVIFESKKVEAFLGYAQQELFGVSVFDPINCIIKNLQAEISSFFLLEILFDFIFLAVFQKEFQSFFFFFFFDNFIISDLSLLQISLKQLGPRVARAAAWIPRKCKKSLPC